MKPDDTLAMAQRPRRSPGRARPPPAPMQLVNLDTTAPAVPPAGRTRWTGVLVTMCYGRAAAAGDFFGPCLHYAFTAGANARVSICGTHYRWRLFLYSICVIKVAHYGLGVHGRVGVEISSFTIKQKIPEIHSPSPRAEGSTCKRPV